jgi:O-antigen/teichoic acid export membrane protein
LAVALLLIFGFGMELMAPVLGFVIAQVGGAFLALFFLARLIRTIPRHSEREPGLERKLLSFSAPLLLTNVVSYLNGRTELFVLGIFLAADMAGIYNAAVRLAGLGLIVLTAFNAIFSPVISDLHNRGEFERLSTLFKLVTRWMLAAAMPIFLVQMLFAPQIMSLFGPEFVAGALTLQVLSVGQVFNIATGGVGVMLIMSGYSHIAFFNSVVTVVLALALDFWLVPRYGLMGAAIAGAVVIVLTNLARLGEVWVLMRAHPFSRAFLKPLVAALPALAAGLAWRQWLPLNSFLHLALACLVVGGVYLLALLLLGLDRGDRVMIEALRVRVMHHLPNARD